MTDIIRDGMLMRLDQLEAQELSRAQVKKALLPSLKEHSRDNPKGLGTQMLNPHIPKPTTAPAGLQVIKTIADLEGEKEDVPTKIKKSFRRYAKYIEAGKDEPEQESRAKFVAEEIAERLDGDEAKTRACVTALAEFMEGRTEAKVTAPTETPAKVDDTAKVAGDLDDED